VRPLREETLFAPALEKSAAVCAPSLNRGNVRDAALREEAAQTVITPQRFNVG
jgi:hypothetical protein